MPYKLPESERVCSGICTLPHRDKAHTIPNPTTKEKTLLDLISKYWCPVNGYNVLFLLILMVYKPHLA